MRHGAAMRIDKPSDMALLPPLPGVPGVPGRPGDTVAPARIGLLAALALTPDACAKLLDEAEIWTTAVQELGPARPLHIGAPAHGAQLLLRGDACAPFERPVPRLRAGLRLWPGHAADGDAPAWSKHLEVFGPRQWAGARHTTTPAPFLRQPLDGGEAAGDAEPDVPADLRDLFEPDREPGARAAPAHLQYPDGHDARRGEFATFGPIAGAGPIGAGGPPARPRQTAEATLRACLRAWPCAESALGSALTAPPDQQLERGLAGDERLELVHLHPQHPTLRIALHGMRPRLLAAASSPPSRTAGPPAPPLWHDLPVRLHTLWLFPLRLRALVLYDAELPDAVLPEAAQRDADASTAPDASPLPGAWPVHLVAAWERLDAPPLEVETMVREAGARAGATQPAGGHDFVQPQSRQAAVPVPGAPAPQSAAQEPAPAPGPAVGPDVAPDIAPHVVPEVVQQEADSASQRARRLLRRLGWDAARIADIDQRGWLPGPAEPLPPLEQLFEQLQAETDALRSRHALDPATIERYVQAAEQGLQDRPAGDDALADALAELQQQTETALAQAGLRGDDVEQLLRSQQPQVWRNLQAAMQTHAPDAPPQPPPPAPTAEAQAPAGAAQAPRALTLRQLREQLRDGASLRGACLDELDLRGIDLSGADLRDAQARGANFAGCAMRGVDLRGALLHDADLRGADLCDARLQGAHLARARLRGSLLRQADASQADFTEAELQGADLRRAVVREAVFEHTDLRQVQAEGCDAQRAQFADCDLRHSLWQDAALEASAWLDCRMQGASLARARAAGICLEGSDLREAELCDADLRGSRATSTTCAGASRMRGADLRDACWAGAALGRADLAGCRLDGADLSGADARGCRLRGIQGSGLRLQGADLRDADLRGAKLLHAMLSGADLRGACMDGALCFGAELDATRGAEPALRGADCRRTIVAARRAAGLAADGEAGEHGARAT